MIHSTPPFVGPPGRVSRLIGESVSGTLHLSWTPPPTIDLTDIDPDLHYNVSIIKTVFSNGTVKNITAISCVECPLLTPKYTFHGPAGCLSIEYKLSVFAFNTAGSGKISSHSYTGDSMYMCTIPVIYSSGPNKFPFRSTIIIV